MDPVDLLTIERPLRQMAADLADSIGRPVLNRDSIPPAAPQEPYTGPVQLMERTPEGKWRPARRNFR